MSNPDPVDPLRPKKPGGMRAGAVAAVLAHLVLIGAITLAVNWRSSTPEGVTAELWAATPQEAAPRGEAPPPPPPPPAPAPEPPKPAPRPEPKPEPAPPPPRDTRAERDAQIAVEKARREKEKEKAEREAEERREKEKAEKLADAKREKERQQKEKERAEKAEQDRREQQLAKEQAARDAAKEKAEREKAEKAAEARREQLRKEQLARMMGQAGATGAPDAAGTAQRSAGPSASYAGRIIARVRPNIVLTDDVPGNPVAEVEVRAGPDGTIVGRKLVKSSGVKSWDDAVLRAIDRTETLPRDVDGRVPSSMIIEFRRGA